jgi:modification methylase
MVQSVWPTGDDPLAALLAYRGYAASSLADEQLFPPDAAEYVIRSLTRPGAVVLDPDCGCGTVPVEAVRAGRHGVGLTPFRTWWRVARTNVNQAKAEGAAADGMVLARLVRHRPVWSETAGLQRRVDLLLTSLRTSRSDRGIDQAFDRLSTNLAACRRLLKPGAYVAVLAPPARDAVTGGLIDIVAGISACGRASNLAVVGRCLAPRWTPPRAAVGPRTSVDGHNAVVVMRSDPCVGEPALVDAAPAAVRNQIASGRQVRDMSMAA